MKTVAPTGQGSPVTRPHRDRRYAVAGELFPVGTPVHVGCGGEIFGVGDERGEADVCQLCGERVPADRPGTSSSRGRDFADGPRSADSMRKLSVELGTGDLHDKLAELLIGNSLSDVLGAVLGHAGARRDESEPGSRAEGWWADVTVALAEAVPLVREAEIASAEDVDK